MAIALFRAVKLVHCQYSVLRKIWRQLLLRLLVFGATIGCLYYIDHVLLLHCVILFKVFPDLLRSSGGQGLLPIDHLLVTFAQVIERVNTTVLSTLPFALYTQRELD